MLRTSSVPPDVATIVVVTNVFEVESSSDVIGVVLRPIGVVSPAEVDNVVVLVMVDVSKATGSTEALLARSGSTMAAVLLSMSRVVCNRTSMTRIVRRVAATSLADELCGTVNTPLTWPEGPKTAIVLT